MNNPFARPHAAVISWLNRERERYAWFDHLARAGGRYQALYGDRVAAGLTYYAFLSFLPLVAVAFAVVGLVVTIDPHLQTELDGALRSNFPGLIGTGDNQISVKALSSAKASVGVIGAIGLLYTGLGWLSAVSAGLRMMWGMAPPVHNFALRKLRDLGLLLLIGFTLLVSLTIAGLGSAFSVQLLSFLGMSHSLTGNLVTKLVSVGLGFLVDLPLFTLLFTGLSDWRPRTRVLRGVILVSAGFEVLKLLGSLLLARTTRNPVYATFAVVVGLLVWMYLVNRVLLFAAAWTVTGPGDDGPTEPQDRPFRRPRAMRAQDDPSAVSGPLDRR